MVSDIVRILEAYLIFLRPYPLLQTLFIRTCLDTLHKASKLHNHFVDFGRSVGAEIRIGLLARLKCGYAKVPNLMQSQPNCNLCII